jgi:hypothetical protein
MLIDIETSDADAVDPLHVYHVLTQAGYLVAGVSVNFGERTFENPEMAEAF